MTLGHCRAVLLKWVLQAQKPRARMRKQAVVGHVRALLPPSLHLLHISVSTGKGDSSLQVVTLTHE